MYVSSCVATRKRNLSEIYPKFLRIFLERPRGRARTRASIFLEYFLSEERCSCVATIYIFFFVINYLRNFSVFLRNFVCAIYSIGAFTWFFLGGVVHLSGKGLSEEVGRVCDGKEKKKKFLGISPPPLSSAACSWRTPPCILEISRFCAPPL